jgi:hypothetical protein
MNARGPSFLRARGDASPTGEAGAPSLRLRIRVEALDSQVAFNPAGVDRLSVTKPRRHVLAGADERLMPMALLPTPTEETLVAARALIREPKVFRPVGEESLRRAVEQIRTEFDEYDTRLIEKMGQEPDDSPSREAFAVALAQRISSTMQMVDAEAGLPPASEGDRPAASVRPTGLDSPGR